MLFVLSDCGLIWVWFTCVCCWLIAAGCSYMMLWYFGGSWLVFNCLFRCMTVCVGLVVPAFVVIGCLLWFVFCCGNSVGCLLLFDFILC